MSSSNHTYTYEELEGMLKEAYEDITPKPSDDDSVSWDQVHSKLTESLTSFDVPLHTRNREIYRYITLSFNPVDKTLIGLTYQDYFNLRTEEA